ncbi:ABC transporter ATP-binding protein [Treponema sp. OMZ 857]|uniref:ABC transporter ATP-binding protein n=1 Tax=Treponema sp. OMZ 857 TaxID=1643513 RepID=UPI0020A24398|nr:ABC transporter ATP-binding protein [Treponema sp. OMZ 857]UTC43562.1 ABC transporter ATP-binding protein [Treponema sp. OMZ 857]
MTENHKQKGVLERVFAVSPKGKGLLAASCIASVLGMVLSLVPYLSVYFICKYFLLGAAGEHGGIVLWTAVAGGAIIGNMVFTFLGSAGCHAVAFDALYRYRLYVMEHLGRISMSYFSTHTSGGIQKVMDENIEKMERFIAHILPDLIGSLVMVIILFLSIAYLNLVLAAAVVAAIIAGFFFQMLVFGGNKVKTIMTAVTQSSTKMTGAFSEYVRGMAEVKLFGRAGAVTNALKQHIAAYMGWEIKSYKNSAFAMSMYKSIVLSLLSVALPVGVWLLARNPSKELILSILMTLILVPALFEPLTGCIEYATQLRMLQAGLVQIDEIVQEPSYIDSDTGAIDTDTDAGAAAFVPHSWEVCFDNVSFSYQKSDDPLRKQALSGISFTAPQGQMTALVGESGGGKSTIGQLLLRFWETEEGAITIGGVSIRDIPFSRLMEYTAAVFQDTYIFAGTVMENIRMHSHASDEAVMEAARQACCHDFIMKLPHGYGTMVGSGHSKLSGGEAQRISTARAILKNTPIVILDEALAYTDAENENQIQTAIKNLVRDKTFIVIAHRLQSIAEAGQILVMQNGKIIERGTHHILMSGDTEYKALWDLQHTVDEWSIDRRHE